MANIISYGIFFDGTGNNKDEGEETQSNVAKLYELYNSDESTHKLYIKGLGTSSAGEIDFGDGNLVSKTFGSGFGLGGQKRVDYAFNVLKEYSDSLGAGDSIQLDLFGFSRGAALARHFSNMVREIEKVSVRFLGLFDTVGSFGIPGNENNASFDLSVSSENIEKVYHLTSFNEIRENFDLVSIKASSDYELPEHMVEEEYPGVHSDIGGGYSNNTEHDNSNNFLALIYLEKMHVVALEAGLPFADIPGEWTPQNDLRELFDTVVGLYQSQPIVQSIHKEMINLKWSQEILTRKKSKIHIPKGPNANSGIAASKRQQKNLMSRSIEYVERTSEEIKSKLDDLLAEQATLLLNTYEDLENNYIHKSHYFYNTTIGMQAQKQTLNIDKQKIEIYQRDIFYI